MTNVTMSLKSVPVSNLAFDPRNPRLPAHVDGEDDQDVLDWMLADAGLVELMGSIATKGFFPAEPLLVTPAPNGTSYWVLEGNRRLASVLLLLDPERAPRRKRAVAEMAEDVQSRAQLEHLPCAVFADRSEVLDYLGYRHITGIKQWEPAAKARYLDSLYVEHLPDAGADVYRYIARLIGSRSDYVMRLLGALRLFEIVVDEQSSLGLHDEDVSFSLLTLSLNYSSIVSFLGLDALTQETFANVDRSALLKLASWLFFERPEISRTQLGESRNMKLLAAAVDHAEGLAALDRGETVEEAATATFDAGDLLARALRSARERLIAAQNLVHRADASELVLNALDEIDDLVDQIRTLVSRKDRAARRRNV